MKVTVLGCSGSMSGIASVASSYLVEAGGTRVLLDLGPGAMGRLLAHEDPALLDAIVLSHLHADHMVDMIGMHVYRRWLPDGELPTLRVLAPAGALARVRGVGGDGEDEVFPEFDFVDTVDGMTQRVGALTLEFFAVHHTVEAYAVRVTGPSEADPERSVTLAYSGDTDACDGLVAAARDADLLLCEAAFLEGRDSVRGVHLTARRAGEQAASAGAARLVLTHLQPWNDAEASLAEARAAYDGPLELAATDARYEL